VRCEEEKIEKSSPATGRCFLGGVGLHGHPHSLASIGCPKTRGSGARGCPLNAINKKMLKIKSKYQRINKCAEQPFFDQQCVATWSFELFFDEESPNTNHV